MFGLPSISKFLIEELIGVPPYECTRKSPSLDKYKIIKLKYNGRTPLFQLKIAKGRIVKIGDKLKLQLTITDEGDQVGLKSLEKGLISQIVKYKRELRIPNFDPNYSGELILRPFNDEEYEFILKIDQCSVFQIPKGDNFVTVDPKNLCEIDLVCSVIVRIDNLHHENALPIPQNYVTSCIILDASKPEVEHTFNPDV